jgi:prepilin-type N-terminal cleavage/methylation domain-containing protein
MRTTTPIREAVREDDGFTLVELLVALVIGSIVLTASLSIFINGLTSTAKVQDRVEAEQRLRVTSDRMTSLLNAQVCSPTGDDPVSDASATSVTFTANIGSVDSSPVRVRLRWDSATNRIYEDQYLVKSDSTYPSVPTTTRVIGTDMIPTSGTTLFKYYGFADAGSGGGLSDAQLTGSPIDTSQVVGVGYDLTALPERTKNSADKTRAQVSGLGTAGSVDPSLPDQGAQC